MTTTHGEYLVRRHNGYRGHPQGSVFVARLPAGAEARAIWRGDIEKISDLTPSLEPGSFTLPAGWLNQQEEGSTDG